MSAFFSLQSIFFACLRIVRSLTVAPVRRRVLGECDDGHTRTVVVYSY